MAEQLRSLERAEVIALRRLGYEVRRETPGRFYVTGRFFTGFMGPEGMRALLALRRHRKEYPE